MTKPNRTVIRGNYSEGFKAPTLYQLQSEYGNALLDPERSKGWDAGITQRAILVRPLADQPDRLRIGLPGCETAVRRLADALQEFKR